VDVAVRQGTVILQLLAIENETLLVGEDGIPFVSLILACKEGRNRARKEGRLRKIRRCKVTVLHVKVFTKIYNP
jgi:hypothetical protein